MERERAKVKRANQQTVAGLNGDDVAARQAIVTTNPGISRSTAMRALHRNNLGADCGRACCRRTLRLTRTPDRHGFSGNRFRRLGFSRWFVFGGAWMMVMELELLKLAVSHSNAQMQAGLCEVNVETILIHLTELLVVANQKLSELKIERG
jgi:hypothetical protein